MSRSGRLEVASARRRAGENFRQQPRAAPSGMDRRRSLRPDKRFLPLRRVFRQHRRVRVEPNGPIEPTLRLQLSPKIRSQQKSASDLNLALEVERTGTGENDP